MEEKIKEELKQKDAEIRKELLKGLLSIWYPDKCNHDNKEEL